jgi:hypothetical protein
MATPITRYAQIAFEQIPFANFPGGGPISQGSTPFGNVGFNDPGIEIGNVREVTAIYQMYGNEASSDIINLYLAQPGTMVSVVGTVCGSGATGGNPTVSGVAASLLLSVGDDDVTGSGLVSNPTQVSTFTDGASAVRYSAPVDISTGKTNPVSFAGGSAQINPYQIGATAYEPQGGNPLTGVAGAWVQAYLNKVATPTAGAVLVFRLKVIKP